MAIKTLIKRYPVPAYFVLAYAVAWGGIALVVGPQVLRTGEGATFAQLLGMWVAMLLGSGGVGLLLTALIEGRAGLRTLLRGVGRWRVGLRWYAPLLISPLVAMSALAVLSQVSPGFVPGVIAASDQTAILAPFLTVAFGTFVEELGWTGFVTRRLRGRYSPLATGLGLGTLWGAWHFMGEFTGRADYGALFPLHFLVAGNGLLLLIAFRVLIVWVYDHTESLLLAMLMHASHSPFLYVLSLSLLAASVAEKVMYETVLTVALWVVVAVVVLQERQSWGRWSMDLATTAVQRGRQT